MRKVVAAINMTLDAFCDHTAGIADDDLHRHYTEVIRNGDVILYGRKTFQLMEFWPPVVKDPTGNSAIDEFAVAIDNIQKIVFSRTLKKVTWRNTRLAKRGIKEEITALKQAANDGNKDILIGSPGLIADCINLGLIVELQLCIHPVVLGKGLPLFKNIKSKIILKLLKTKTLSSGAVVHYYEPAKNN